MPLSSIRINENIFSLFVNRHMQRSSARLNSSFERLSSGQRINQAGDDPAGLAVSNSLRAKITGLNRNLMNCNEGLNLLSVAESSLSNITDALQRMRELAVQASSDTVTDDQRLLIQEEMDGLIDEIERIASTANYNEKNLLDGSFANLRLQVGTRIDESIPLSIEDTRTSVLGSLAVVTGANTVDGTPIAGTGDLTINGITIPISQFDGVSTVEGDASAIAKAKAINAMQNLTKVKAKVGAAVFDDSAASIGGGTLDGAGSSLIINGVNIGNVTWEAGDTTGALRDRINGFTSLTGVTASRGVNGELVLTAEDGRNVELITTGSIADELGLQAADGDVSTIFRGTVTLQSADTIQLGGTGALIGMTAPQATTFVDNALAVGGISIVTFADAQDALDRIDAAQQQILERRAALGSIDARIQQTITDIQINVENLSSSNSRIRDADFAVESAELTQAQIIQEAGVAMLAQANVIPQLALNLIQR